MREGPSIDRRRFLIAASGTVAGLALSSTFGCRRSGEEPAPATAPEIDFPFLEVSGSPYEIGLAIGRRFGDQVREGIRRRRDWFDGLRRFMDEDRATRLEPFVAAAEQHFPHTLEELRGWADGAGLPVEDLLTLNLKAELAALRAVAAPETPGCSTLALSHGGRTLIAHNEDGHGAYHDLMFLVRVAQPGRPAFLCLTYPGILCGNGPAINEAGIAVTTNFIGGLAVRPGVPRYVLSRALLGARSLDEAVAIVTHPDRAFAFHYNLGSRDEGKILSVETSVERSSVQEVHGLYVHTNHLLHAEMAETPQDAAYVESSSMSRYRVLSEKAQRFDGRLDEVGEETLVELLSSHEGAPYSPCRHPDGEVSGATLGSALIDAGAGDVRLYYSNPCREPIGPPHGLTSTDPLDEHPHAGQKSGPERNLISEAGAGSAPAALRPSGNARIPTFPASD